ncbi:hypothetical protein QN239_32875 [Mycolicibacterium sp. Y3]
MSIESVLAGHGDPIVLVALGAIGMFVALALLRFVRRVRRMIWTAAVLAAASGAGASGGWAVLDALKIKH